MHTSPFVLAALTAVAASPAARQEGPQAVIRVGSQSFQTWAEYVQSDAFRALGLRCGIPAHTAPAEARPPSDCSFSSTSILPEYEPAGGTLYEIPVVVHLIEHTNGDGDVPDSMVHEQIAVLNEDFRAIAGTLGENGTDCMIQFYLAQFDPDGDPTTGITRTVNNTWFNDGGSYWDSLSWDTSRYLNLYSNSASGFLGYVPDLPQGGLVGDPEDRVVVLWSTVGRDAPIGPPYHLGRTATHEVGHYFGLNHTFSGGCAPPGSCYTNGDLICDTNPEGGPVFGCPVASSSCGLPDPFDNYMDYSDDDCYERFTPEQANRMRCSIANYRDDLPQPEIPCGTASATARNAGTNPASYFATAPILGGETTLSVTDFTYNTAIVIARIAPATLPLPGGQTLLVDVGSAFLFSQTLSLPMGSVDLPIPADVSLCGATAYTQAVLFGGAPFALSNAMDLVVGAP